MDKTPLTLMTDSDARTYFRMTAMSRKKEPIKISKKLVDTLAPIIKTKLKGKIVFIPGQNIFCSADEIDELANGELMQIEDLCKKLSPKLIFKYGKMADENEDLLKDGEDK